jgi:2-acylglycerol O-acyltransferase 2
VDNVSDTTKVAWRRRREKGGDSCLHVRVFSSSSAKKKTGCRCRWAPFFRIPLERRLQTAAVLVIILIFPLTILSNVFLLFFWPLNGLYACYLLWFIIMDRDTPQRGGRAPIGRRWSLWKLFRNYFPSDLVVEGTLDPKHTYVFGIHPHGVIGMAVWANMMNNVNGALSSIDYRLVTLKSNFYIPITREWLLWLGAIGSDKRGITTALKQGKSVMIVVGGAAEALEIHKEYHGIVLDKRRGFVEIAIRTGSHLVPIFNFGENELYHVATSNAIGTKVREWQEKMKDWFGFTLPVVHGRGIWNYSFVRVYLLPSIANSFLSGNVAVSHASDDSDWKADSGGED